MQLQNRVAVVTGAASGIGRASAELMAREGARIVAVDVSEDDLRDLRDSIEHEGGEVLTVQADVGDEHDMQRVYARAMERFGRLDVVFANAGINGVWAPIDELEPEEWDQTIRTNLRGTFLTVKYAVPHLKQHSQERRASIIITASVNGTRIFSNTGATAYSCTKAAQLAMMQMLALELASDKVRVNAICPGAVGTNIEESTEKRDVDKVKPDVEFKGEGTPPLSGGFPAEAEEVAKLVLFLASDASQHISGTPIWIDGAQSLLQG